MSDVQDYYRFYPKLRACVDADDFAQFESLLENFQNKQSALKGILHDVVQQKRESFMPYIMRNGMSVTGVCKCGQQAIGVFREKKLFAELVSAHAAAASRGEALLFVRLGRHGHKIVSKVVQGVENPLEVKTVDVSYSDLDEVPDLERFTKLNTLKLPNNMLLRFSVNWTAMANLRILKLEHNSLTSIPDEISELSSLSELNINHNQIAVLPRGVFRLRVMVRLYVSNNLLSEIPPEIANIHALLYLDVNYNRLTVLPSEVGQLSDLVGLYVEGNMIEELPSSIGNLERLEVLNARRNKLRSLPGTTGLLTSLKSLFLDGNNIEALPSSMGHLENLKTINLRGNNGIAPAQLLNWDMEQIKAYLKETLFNGEKCNRAKVVVIGQEGVGKTCVVRAFNATSRKSLLRRKNTPVANLPIDRTKAIKKAFLKHRNISTDGIDISRLGLSVDRDLGFVENKLELQLYDFGGQEVFTMTHSLFLSNDAVYIVVFNPLKEDSENRLGYWLSSLSATLAQGSQRSARRMLNQSFKVLVVATHSDQVDEQTLDERFAAILARQESRQLKLTREDCISVSSKTGNGIPALIDMMRQRALGLNHIVGEQFPKRYFNVQRRAEELAAQFQAKKRAPVMRWSEFIESASDIISEPFEMEEAVEFAHNQGLVMHYMYRQLRDWIILDPQWLPKLMSSVVSFRTAGLIKNGILMHSDIVSHRLWDDFPREIHPFLMALLQKFGVVVPLDDDNKRSLVPAMLHNAVEQTLDFSELDPPFGASYTYRRRYKLDFTPKDFYPRLLVRLVQFFELSACTWAWGIFRYSQHRSPLEPQNGENGENGALNNNEDLPECDTTAVLCVVDDVVELSVWGSSENSAVTTFTLIHGQVLTTAQFWANLHVDQSVVPRDNSAHLSVAELDFTDVDFLPEFGKRIPEANFTDMAEIGRGSFGIVWEAKMRDGKEWDLVALKEMAEADNDSMADFTREVDIMSRLQHPNIIKLFGVTTIEKNPAMVIEFAPCGSLSMILDNRDIELSPEFRARVALDVALAVRYLHSLHPRVVHRDLKCGNVLLFSTSDQDAADLSKPIAKLADFGLTVHFVASIELDSMTSQNPRWLAPEIIRGEPHNHLSDVYSYGMLLSEILLRQTPFDEPQWRDYLIEKAVLKGERPNFRGIEDEKLLQLSKLCEKCWAAEASQRPEFNSIVLQLKKIIGFQLSTPRILRVRALPDEFVQSIKELNGSTFDVMNGITSKCEPHREEIAGLDMLFEGTLPGVSLVQLKSNDAQYQSVMKLIEKRAENIEIKSISLIANPEQVLRFVRFRETLNMPLRKVKRLFYFGNSIAFKSIAQSGFNSTFCGAGPFGWGTYFAKSPAVHFARHGFAVTAAIDQETRQTVAELHVPLSKSALTKTRLVIYNERGKSRTVVANDSAKLKLDSKNANHVMLDKEVLVQHSGPCEIEQYHSVLIADVVVGTEKCTVTRKQMENALCRFSSACGGPSGQQDMPAHIVHWSPNESEICVPLRHGYKGAQDISTEWQILPRFIVNFTGKPKQHQ